MFAEVTLSVFLPFVNIILIYAEFGWIWALQAEVTTCIKFARYLTIRLFTGLSLPSLNVPPLSVRQMI